MTGKTQKDFIKIVDTKKTPSIISRNSNFTGYIVAIENEYAIVSKELDWVTILPQFIKSINDVEHLVNIIDDSYSTWQEERNNKETKFLKESYWVN